MQNDNFDETLNEKEKVIEIIDTVESDTISDDSEKEILTEIQYTIKLEEYEKAFIAFQKKYVYPKNFVLSTGFAIVFFVYLFQLIKDPGFQFGWFLVAVCFLSIVMIWFNPVKIRKNLMKSICHIKEDKYTTKISNVDIEINTEIGEIDETNEDVEIPPKIISYEFDAPEIIELSDMFVVYLRKQMFYVIPKREMNAEQEGIISNIFKEKLGKKYFVK